MVGSTAGSGPKRRLSRRTVLALAVGLAAVAVAVLLILFVVVLPNATKPPRVEITAANLDFTPSANPCFGPEYTDQSPATLAVGGSETLFANLSNGNNSEARSCTVQAISLDSPGFTISSANVPLRVNNTGESTLVIVVRVPSQAYTGELNLSASVTYVAANVTVNAVDFAWNPTSAVSPCGLDTPTATPSQFLGFPVSDVNISAIFASTDGTEYSCTLTSVDVTTHGFSLISSDAPVVIEFDTFSGVSFEVLLPPAEFNGTLDVTLNVST